MSDIQTMQGALNVLQPENERLRAENDALNLRVKVLEKALEEAAQTECAAICRKIRQDAQIADALVRFGGRGGLGDALRGLADEIERGEREQV